MERNTHTMVAKTAGNGNDFHAVYIVDVGYSDQNENRQVERWTVIEGNEIVSFVGPRGDVVEWRPDFEPHSLLAQLTTYIDAQFPSWEAERDDTVEINESLIRTLEAEKKALTERAEKLDDEIMDVAKYLYALRSVSSAEELTEVMESH